MLPSLTSLVVVAPAPMCRAVELAPWALLRIVPVLWIPPVIVVAPPPATPIWMAVAETGAGRVGEATLSETPWAATGPCTVRPDPFAVGGPPAPVVGSPLRPAAVCRAGALR